MPESFESMLAELADAAVAATSLPDIGSVRRRARQRTLRRRLAAGAAALVVAAGCGGAYAAVTARSAPAKTSVPLGPPSAGLPSAGLPSPGADGRPTPPLTPSATGGPGNPDASSAAGAPTPYAQVAGEWRQSGGPQQYLIIFADGVIGMREAGSWEACDGRLHPQDSITFMVIRMSCGDFGTTGLFLHLIDNGADLSLVVPPQLGIAGHAVLFQRVGTVPGNQADTSVILPVIGSWSNGLGTDRTVRIAKNGSVILTGLDNAAKSVKDFGEITGYYDNGLRVEVPCSGSAAPLVPGTGCGLLFLEPLSAKGVLTVVGGYGPETFTFVGAQGGSTGSAVWPPGASGA